MREEKQFTMPLPSCLECVMCAWQAVVTWATRCYGGGVDGHLWWREASLRRISSQTHLFGGVLPEQKCLRSHMLPRI